MRALRQWIGGAGRERTARCGPIGVELSAEKLHLVQLERAGGSLGVRAHASVPLPARRQALLDSELAFRKMLGRGLSCDRFKGTRAVLALPPGEFRTLALDYRLAAGEHEASVLAALVAQRLGSDPADQLIDFAPLPCASGGREARRALVAVSSRERVIRYLDLARLAGLRVQALEIGPTAIRRLVGALPDKHDPDATLVVNTGRRASYLTLIGGGHLLSDEEVDIGEDQLIARVSTGLGIPAAKARLLALGHGLRATQRLHPRYEGLADILRGDLDRLARVIADACREGTALDNGAEITRVYLLGGLARWPGMCETLSRMMSLAITQMPNPLSLFGGDDDFADTTVDPLAPELAVATGLALRGLQPRRSRPG